jgi:hypothetical protein
MTYDIGIDEFPKNLTITKTSLLLQGMVLGSTFKWSSRQLKTFDRVGGDRNSIMAVTLMCTRHFPSMHLEDSFDLHFTGELVVEDDE